MHSTPALFAAFALVMTPLLSTVAWSTDLGHAAAARQTNIVRVTEQCAADEYWEQAGYVAEGKWRDAHCAKVNGRQ